MGFQAPVEVAAPKKAAASKRAETACPQLEKLASLAAVIEALQTRYQTLDAEVRGNVYEEMLADGAKHAKSPGGYALVDGIGSANYQIKARSSASAVSDEVYDALKEAGVPVEIAVTTPSYLAVNPKYASNQEMLALADKLLTGQDGIPDDFIVKTPEVSKKIVTNGAIDKVFGTGDADQIRALLPHVATFAIAQIRVSDFPHALKVCGPEIDALFSTDKIAPVAAKPNLKVVAA